MKFSSEFLLGATPNQVWSTISDTDSLLSLVPGLHPVAHEGDHLVCRADVAVGSFSAELAGRIHVVDDESAHSVVVEVRTIQADDESNSLTAEVRLHQVDGHCRITVDTTTHLTGDLGAVDGVTLQHAWERLLRRVFERLDLSFIGPAANQPTNPLLKYAATGVAAAFQTIVGFATGHPFNPLRLFRRPPEGWPGPPQDPD